MECMVIFSSDRPMKLHTIIDVSDWDRRFNTRDTGAPIPFNGGHHK